jgi:uncharacterized membrane protein SpoIIM required for sporulation
MTPVQFEAEYGALWRELEAGLDRIERHRPGKPGDDPGTSAIQIQAIPVDGARLTALYRRSCEHLALAQARAYPIGLTQRLQTLTYRAHRLIYRRQDYGAERLQQLVLVEIPRAVRLHRAYLLAAILLFLVPTLLVGWTTYRDPAFALHVLSAQDLGHFREMYGGEAEMLGHVRGAESDWARFGFYLMHNISLGFQCFAGGIFAGLGSAFFLALNGVYNGAVAGYLTEYGYATNFYSFVLTHGAFELTAICLSGAAGLRIGHALVAPGRRTRLDSVQHAAAEAVVLIYAVFAMLLIAAAIEAFWSAAPWVLPHAKFAVGASAWAIVIAYLAWRGKPQPASSVAARGQPHAG